MALCSRCGSLLRGSLLIANGRAAAHGPTERSSAEKKALDQALALAHRVDGRVGSIETILLTLVHSVSPRPADSLRNDRLLRNVAAELPPEFAQLYLSTPSGSPDWNFGYAAERWREARTLLQRMPKTLFLTFRYVSGSNALTERMGRLRSPSFAYEDPHSKGSWSPVSVTLHTSAARADSRRGFPSDAIGTIIGSAGWWPSRSSDPE